MLGRMNKVSVERSDRGYAFLTFVSGSHDHVRTRVWAHNALVRKDNQGREYIDFPVPGAYLWKTEKGSFVLRASDIRHNPKPCVYLVEIRSGYRGAAAIEKIAAMYGEAEVVLKGARYHSPRGTLGETAWTLVNVPEGGPIDVFGRRSGRRIDNPEVSFRLTPDGEVEEIIQDGEVCTILEE